MNRRDAIRALMALPAVKTIEVSQLQPNDIIVINCEDVLSQTQIQNIQDAMKLVWPNNKIAVLDRGLSMRVVKA